MYVDFLLSNITVQLFWMGIAPNITTNRKSKITNLILKICSNIILFPVNKRLLKCIQTISLMSSFKNFLLPI